MLVCDNERTLSDQYGIILKEWLNQKWRICLYLLDSNPCDLLSSIEQNKWTFEEYSGHFFQTRVQKYHESLIRVHMTLRWHFKSSEGIRLQCVGNGSIYWISLIWGMNNHFGPDFEPDCMIFFIRSKSKKWFVNKLDISKCLSCFSVNKVINTHTNAIRWTFLTKCYKMNIPHKML